jgi:hypothetical protein
MSWETNALREVSTFTIGGRAATQTVQTNLNTGGDYPGAYIGLWNEAAISAMSGTTISFTWSGTKPTFIVHGYATFQDAEEQASLVTDSQTGDSVNNVSLGTESNSGDIIVMACSDTVDARSPYTVTGTETQVLSDSSGNWNGYVYTVAGNQNPTVWENDLVASNSEMAAVSAVIKASGGSSGLLGSTGRGVLRGLGRGL